MSQISVTEDALKNIRRLQTEYDASGFGLRFGITGGGCSGYKYVLELEDSPDEDDRVFKFSDVAVFVKNEHMEKLQNSTIGWTETLMESGFEIDNPQAKRPCGCGESVSF